MCFTFTQNSPPPHPKFSVLVLLNKVKLATQCIEVLSGVHLNKFGLVWSTWFEVWFPTVELNRAVLNFRSRPKFKYTRQIYNNLIIAKGMEIIVSFGPIIIVFSQDAWWWYSANDAVYLYFFYVVLPDIFNLKGVHALNPLLSDRVKVGLCLENH